MKRLVLPGFLFLSLLLHAAPAAQAQGIVRVTSADITADTRWTANNTYLLDGFVFVEPGETLRIEAGTVVKARPGTGENASALIIARGAKLLADGTAEAPIVFTAEADDVADPFDLLPTDRGRWGGIVVLGRATLNTATPVQTIEGIPSALGAVYGCNRDGNLPAEPACDDDDDSGVLRYVSVRHGGSELAPGHELNGISFGGVGRGTTVEHVEVIYNADDGFEFFGGTVNTRYLVSAFNDDDAFDYDQGYRGLNQFWFVLQADDTGDYGGEFDGGDDPAPTSRPYAIPTIANATFIGSGPAPSNTKSNRGLLFRVNAGGMVYNSVFTGFKGYGINVEDLPEATAAQDSRARLEAGDLVLRGNLFGVFGVGAAAEQVMPQEFVRTALLAAGNLLADPMLGAVSRLPDAGLDPRPAAGSPALVAGPEQPSDPFFTPTTYRGAFGSVNWLRGWTALDALGYLAPETGTAIDDAGEVPGGIGLAQNYPNPFNPATTIAFTLDRAQAVHLAVYDLMGREVAVLVEGVQAAGAHRVSFDATGLASGLYLYRLRAGQRTLTRGLTVQK